MFTPKNFIQVTREDFYEFFKNKTYITKQGVSFHSDTFIIDGEEVGYMATSSYGAPDYYAIKSDIHCENHLTINFIGGVIRNKDK